MTIVENGNCQNNKRGNKFINICRFILLLWFPHWYCIAYIVYLHIEDSGVLYSWYSLRWGEDKQTVSHNVRIKTTKTTNLSLYKAKHQASHNIMVYIIGTFIGGFIMGIIFGFIMAFSAFTSN